MLDAIWALNNITAHRLLIAHYGISSDSYCHQTMNNFEKPLIQENRENSLMITGLIFLILYMYIWLTKLLEDSIPNGKFDTDGRLCIGSTGLNWDDSNKIVETIAANKDNKDKEEDLWERNR